MLNNDRIKNLFKNELDAYAHCDIPCGIYDPNDAIQAAKTVVKMTELMEGLDVSGGPSPSLANSMMRYVYAKEIHAKKAKDDVLVLWTDYFKPAHLEKYPDLHEKVWNACKLGSFVKVNVDLGKAKEFQAALEEIGDGLKFLLWRGRRRCAGGCTRSVRYQRVSQLHAHLHQLPHKRLRRRLGALAPPGG